MARIKLVLPQNKLATVSIPIRITDINYGNHVGNDALVSIIHEARMLFLKQHGFTELNAGGNELIMSELVINYKNESFYNDILVIQIFCGEITKFSFELYYQIITKRDGKEWLIANAKTGMVCYNYTSKKPEELGEELHRILVSKD